jgi:G3E family GTPase
MERRPLSVTRHGEAGFQSFTYSTDAGLDEDKFRKLVSDLPPAVFRAKGFVRLDATSYLFNYVVGRPDLEEFGADRTQLVFIGRRLDEVRDRILEELRRCEVS